MDEFPWRVEELHKELADWESIYNCVRPHQALGYKTPLQVLLSLAASYVLKESNGSRPNDASFFKIRMPWKTSAPVWTGRKLNGRPFHKC